MATLSWFLLFTNSEIKQKTQVNRYNTISFLTFPSPYVVKMAVIFLQGNKFYVICLKQPVGQWELRLPLGSFCWQKENTANGLSVRIACKSAVITVLYGILCTTFWWNYDIIHSLLCALKEYIHLGHKSNYLIKYYRYTDISMRIHNDSQTTQSQAEGGRDNRKVKILQEASTHYQKLNV